MIGSPNQRQSLLELDGREAATQRLLTVAGSTPDEAVLHANVAAPAFYDVAIDVTFGSIDVYDVSRHAANEHRRSNGRGILVERVHEEVSVSCDCTGRSRERLEETSFELEPRMGHFNDDGELRPAGINPIERRAHALKNGSTLVDSWSVPGGLIEVGSSDAGLGPRMGFGVSLLEVVSGDVRVDLRRAEVRMPEHRLHGAQIGPPAE